MTANSVMLRLLNAVENDNTEDLYEIVNEFRNNGPEDTGIINTMFATLDNLESKNGIMSCCSVRVTNEGSLVYIKIIDGIPVEVSELYGENDDVELKLMSPNEDKLLRIISNILGEVEE